MKTIEVTIKCSLVFPENATDIEVKHFIENTTTRVFEDSLFEVEQVKYKEINVDTGKFKTKS